VIHPYVGVSGFMHRDEVLAAITIWREAWGDREPTHDLMVGVLASAKTIGGSPNKYPRRYPDASQIASIFVEAPGVLNLLHYASDRVPDSADIFLLHTLAGQRCHGFQFNLSWPERIDLVNLFGHVGSRRVVLQAGPKLVREKGGPALADMLRPYADHTFRANYGDALATDVLLDASGGNGVSIDPLEASGPLAVISNRLPCLRLGIAGGFCAEKLTPTFAPILRAGVSIDAEGRLRDDADGGGNLDLLKVGAYLRAAVSILTGATS
jgi:hypothetical protein